MVPAYELPRFTSGAEPETPRLAASRAVVTLFLREGSSSFSVKELAAHAGLAERTFYRYFPHKEDAVQPYLEAGLDAVVARLRVTLADLPLREALVDGLGAVFELARDLDLRPLLGVLSSNDRLRSVWLKVLTDAASMFAEVVAQRLEIPAGGTRARFVGAAIVSAGRIALDARDRAPSEVFAECLAMLDPAVLGEEVA